MGAVELDVRTTGITPSTPFITGRGDKSTPHMVLSLAPATVAERLGSEVLAGPRGARRARLDGALFAPGRQVGRPRALEAPGCEENEAMVVTRSGWRLGRQVGLVDEPVLMAPLDFKGHEPLR